MIWYFMSLNLAWNKKIRFSFENNNIEYITSTAQSTLGHSGNGTGAKRFLCNCQTFSGNIKFEHNIPHKCIQPWCCNWSHYKPRWWEDLYSWWWHCRSPRYCQRRPADYFPTSWSTKMSCWRICRGGTTWMCPPRPSPTQPSTTNSY